MIQVNLRSNLIKNLKDDINKISSGEYNEDIENNIIKTLCLLDNIIFCEIDDGK